MHRHTMRVVAATGAAFALALSHAPAAHGYEFKRTLSRGARSGAVRALEVRVAGWHPARSQKLLRVDRLFGHRTVAAVKAFQRHYGLAVDGIAGPQTFATLARLEDRDGSTKHFSWNEFKQQGKGCNGRSARYEGTFRGGGTSAAAVRRHVRQLMWRLEVMRAKAGGAPILITSGFRSRSYNKCIGGARRSQHTYGLAADYRIAGIGPHRSRRLAKGSQVHGLQCYSSDSFNHMDLRMENNKLSWLHHWWWPDVDKHGRHLADEGVPCWGE